MIDHTNSIETGLNVQAQGINYPVLLTERGEFVTTVRGQEIGAPSLDRLGTLARQAAKEAARISVPFTHFSHRFGQRNGVLTGVHATQHRVILVRWADGKAVTVKLYEMDTPLRLLSEAESSELSTLAMRLTEATRELDAFLEPRKVDLWALAQEAS